MQLTMEPLDEMVASARAMDGAGMDTIWLAEAYPWWRKHGMEARSSTVVSGVLARETERLTIGWGIISPFTSLGTKGMGEGGGAGIHAICAALQDALRSQGNAIVYDSCNPYHRVWELLSEPEASRARVTVEPAA